MNEENILDINNTVLLFDLHVDKQMVPPNAKDRSSNVEPAKVDASVIEK